MLYPLSYGCIIAILPFLSTTFKPLLARISGVFAGFAAVGGKARKHTRKRSGGFVGSHSLLTSSRHLLLSRFPGRSSDSLLIRRLLSRRSHHVLLFIRHIQGLVLPMFPIIAPVLKSFQGLLRNWFCR